MTIASTAQSRFILMPEAKAEETAAEVPRVRRYRLARLSVNGRRSAADRHAHLKRVYD